MGRRRPTNVCMSPCDSHSCPARSCGLRSGRGGLARGVLVVHPGRHSLSARDALTTRVSASRAPQTLRGRFPGVQAWILRTECTARSSTRYLLYGTLAAEPNTRLRPRVPLRVPPSSLPRPLPPPLQEHRTPSMSNMTPTKRQRAAPASLYGIIRPLWGRTLLRRLSQDCMLQ